MAPGGQDKEFLDPYTLYSENAKLKNAQIFRYHIVSVNHGFMEGQTEWSGLVRSL
jgi:hypothetical protein